MVVDLDEPHEGAGPPAAWAGCRHGRDVLARLAARANAPYPGNTRAVITPSGGWHLIFSKPDGLELRNSRGKLGWCVDTRAGGGYVVAAGSIIAGRRYRVGNPQPPVELPAWLGELLTRQPAPPVPIPRPMLARREIVSAYVRSKVNRWSLIVARAVPGERHDLLLRAAVAFGGLVGAGMLEERVASEVLRRAGAKHVGVEAFTERELERTIAQGIAWGITHSRELRVTGERWSPL